MKAKIKFEIKKEVVEDIHTCAGHLSMYDDRFPEEDQCGGYDAFKELCLQVDELPDIKNMTREDFIHMHGELSEVNHLNRIHPLARQPALELANKIRKKHKIGDSWRTIKKESM